MGSKREKFERIRDTRLPKAIKAIKLLQNLGRKSDYDYNENLAREITDQLYDAVDGVAGALGLPSEDALGMPPTIDQPCLPDQEENRSSLPEQATQRAAVEGGPAGGGAGQVLPTTGGHTVGRSSGVETPVQAPHRSRVRWALDMLKRGDQKDAEKVVTQIIAEWIEDEQP